MPAAEAREATTRRQQRHYSGLSPQNRSRQAAVITPGPSTPPLVLSYRRHYLKALRQAELATWQRSEPGADPRSMVSPNNLRLPSPDGSKAENRLLILLALLCFVTLGGVLRTLLPRAANWRHFVHLVRQLLN